jgi:hypothetical protein
MALHLFASVRGLHRVFGGKLLLLDLMDRV